MKSSWITGIVLLYLIILGCELMATGGAGGDSFASSENFTDNGTMESASIFLQPSYKSFGVVVVFMQAAEFLRFWGQVLMLYSPTVFSGQMLWIYWFFCFPVACAMIFTIFTIIRGTGST